MLNKTISIRTCALLFSFTCATLAAQLPPSFLPHRYTQYYHYPVPRQQFPFPASKPTTQQQQQKYLGYSHIYKQHYAQQQTRSYQQQQQQQQQYRTQSTKTVNSYYQQSTRANNNNIIQKFTSPTLENAAFTTALTSQGYNFVGGNGGANARSINNPAASSIFSARVLPAASSLSLMAANAVESGYNNNNDIGTDGSIDLTDSSINLKLPLPVNIAPIKASPLPLQAGTSFSQLANGVTSYGTTYPQRKR
ncbi:TPR-containing protein DDB_G0280363 [Eurosta solidaginis]|uniref:TPR-containing protein DDB_G0280363 n=1 Tax=Eurosta solidaginis TaxID=178769 RepID=UPI003531416E